MNFWMCASSSASTFAEAGLPFSSTWRLMAPCSVSTMIHELPPASLLR